MFPPPQPPKPDYCSFVLPIGIHKGKTLGAILDDPKIGTPYLRWLLRMGTTVGVNAALTEKIRSVLEGTE